MNAFVRDRSIKGKIDFVIIQHNIFIHFQAQQNEASSERDSNVNIGSSQYPGYVN